MQGRFYSTIIQTDHHYGEIRRYRQNCSGLKERACGDVAKIPKEGSYDKAIESIRKRSKTVREQKRREREKCVLATKQAISSGALLLYISTIG